MRQMNQMPYIIGVVIHIHISATRFSVSLLPHFSAAPCLCIHVIHIQQKICTIYITQPILSPV